MTHEAPPVDFAKVDMLRKHMLLSVTDIAKVFGVSRMTYYTWLKGGGMRATTTPRVKKRLRALLAVMKEHQWPNNEVLVMPPPKRVEHLLELLGQEQ